MNYRTIVAPKDYDFEISHQSNLLLIGSCFSENIGSKLISNKFNTLINPSGILFNPISIVNTLNDIIEEKEKYSVYIKKNKDVLPWKDFNKNMAVSVEYNLEY